MTNTTYLKFCVWLCQRSGKPALGGLEQKILAEALAGKKLKDIDIEGFSSHYIGRVVAPNLWKTLSDCCEQRVGIRRLKLVLDQTYSQLTPSERTGILAVPTKINLDDKGTDPQGQPEQSGLYDSSPCPVVKDELYNHESTFSTLKHLIEENYHSLIFVYGAVGIGKTSLVSQLLTDFVRIPVVWCNLSEQDKFEENIASIRNYWDFPVSSSGAIASLCDYLQQHPVLLVFDQWESLFAEDELSGTYQQQHQQYAQLLDELAKRSLAGRVMVLSSTITPSMKTLNVAEKLVVNFQIPDLNHDEAKKILREYDIKDQELWLGFIRTYNGNPLHLRLLCSAIREWHGASIARFQQQNTVIGGDTLRDILRQLTEPVTEFEKKILNWLMLWGQPINLPQLQDYFVDKVTFPTQVWDAIRSLERRFLLDKSNNTELPILKLKPSIHRYLMQEFVQGYCEELWVAIAAGYELAELRLLRDYQLIINGTMPKTIETVPPVIAAILKGLRQKSGSDDRLNFHLDQLTLATQANPSLCQPHGLFNLNLLSQSANLLVPSI
ncbi:WD repeat-containing protein [[Leptolyngbya] sp. PCC 7376]|uniref:AAA family ATPase n=1 Tax=[Leptolyngbya] sp. PCC 7376 TaxID=111781 RepID=UPI00029F1E8D|nr:AAA family ATPase [[Leptolyngbya] sp. PCC 7376]AFY37871.1 WD repeat-containing protein [[Leptolyngbya] sp. PCC 7376]